MLPIFPVPPRIYLSVVNKYKANLNAFSLIPNSLVVREKKKKKKKKNVDRAQTLL